MIIDAHAHLYEILKGYGAKGETVSTDYYTTFSDGEVADYCAEYHEAVTTFPIDDPDKKGKVIDCVQKGYTMNDKVITLENGKDIEDVKNEMFMNITDSQFVDILYDCFL